MFAAASVGSGAEDRFTVRLLTTANELRPFLPAWQALAASALEPNAFYEPWQVIPALQCLSDAPALELLLVLNDNTEPPSVCGVFPLQRRATYRGLPVPSLRMWQHKYCFLCTPLVSRAHASSTLRCFLTWLASNSTRCEVMSLQSVRADGAFAEALKQALTEFKRPHFEEACYARALLEVSGAQDGLAYLDTALSKKKTKEYRRLAQRLSEQGTMQFERLLPGAALLPWLDEFLALEASGWKGREGSITLSSVSEDRS